MPVTPFHIPIAYLTHKLGGTLSLPGLVVGSVLPDLEIPFFFMVFWGQDPNRMVLHSLLGASTVGTILAVAITAWVYPTLISRLFRVDNLKLKQKCSPSISLAVSCLIGILSHTLLDVTNHAYNPVIWPFLSMNDTPSPVTPLLGGAFVASLIVHFLLALLFVIVYIQKRERFWEQLLVG